MFCNKCGRENPDDAPSCGGCGHKLQSSFASRRDERGPLLDPLPPVRELGPAARRRLGRLVEAWAVAGLVWVAAYLFLKAGMTWTLYPLAVLAVLYALMRGITWKD